MGNSDHNNSNDDHHYSTPVEEEEEEGLMCKLDNIKTIKVRGSCDHGDHDDDDDDDQGRKIDGGDDGYTTPTETEHLITVDLRRPPPAPKKPKAQLMKRRRTCRRSLLRVSPQDIELLFPPRFVKETLTHSNSGTTIDPNGNINKVNTNQANYTTNPLMSLR